MIKAKKMPTTLWFVVFIMWVSFFWLSVYSVQTSIKKCNKF